jgi:cyclic pyranopterin phosphate synthase
LLRRDLAVLVKGLAARPRIRDLAMTTNGVLLAEHAQPLKDAGLHRITVSLDTLRHDRFTSLARFDELDRVVAGIDAAASVFGEVKIDTVVIRGLNDDELADVIEFGRPRNAEVRFIEYMDVGGATQWSMDRVVSKTQMLDTLARRYGAVTPIVDDSSAPARRYRLSDGTVFGIIASTTAPFCSDCDRSRLTADGMWFLCLYATEGRDLRRALRSGASRAEIASIIRAAWQGRRDRGAEDRLASGGRSPLIPLDRLRRDPHLEMHTRGG